MKEKRLEILQKVANGEITPEQAHTELLGLSIVSVSLPSSEDIEKVARARFKGRNYTKWKAGMFKAGANWMKSVAIGCSDVVGSKEYVGNHLLAEKMILALDDYGRNVNSIEYGLPIDSDTKDFEGKRPQEMLKIITDILNYC